MKRSMLIAVAVVAGGALFGSVCAEAKPKKEKAKADAGASTASAPAAASPMLEGTVAYTFSNDDQIKQFAQMWQQRQTSLAKMAVLQGYWKQEEAAVIKLNQELLEKYKLDVAKNYSLDANRKVLIERPATTLAPGQTSLDATPAKATP